MSGAAWPVCCACFARLSLRACGPLSRGSQLRVNARLSAPAATGAMHAGKALKGAHWHCRAAGAITGDIRVGGFPKEQHTFARVMGYVEQTDIHSPMVQAWRSLFFHRISGGFRYI